MRPPSPAGAWGRFDRRRSALCASVVGHLLLRRQLVGGVSPGETGNGWRDGCPSVGGGFPVLFQPSVIVPISVEDALPRVLQELVQPAPEQRGTLVL